MMSAQSERRLQKFSSAQSLFRILVSIAAEGYSCSKVTGNRSRKASLSTLVPMNRPSSLPLPLVFAVAMTLKPALGRTNLPIFLRKTPFPSRILWRQRILLEARSTSSRSRTAPRSSASMTGPLCQTVAPSTRRKPPIRSSSSVSIVMFTRISSRPSWAQLAQQKTFYRCPRDP